MPGVFSRGPYPNHRTLSMSRSCSLYPFSNKWSKTASIGLIADEGGEGSRHAARARARARTPSEGSGALVAWFPFIVRIP